MIILFSFICCVFLNFFSTFFILFLGQRETEHERGRGRERGRHRIGNRLQAPSHQPGARRGAPTHGPRDCDLAEVGRLTDCATQAPHRFNQVSMEIPMYFFKNWPNDSNADLEEETQETKEMFSKK